MAKIILRILMILLVITIGAAFYTYETNLIKEHVEIEAGTEASPFLFLKKDDPGASFSEGISDTEVYTPGDYEVKIKTGLFSHKAVLTVVDTTPPVLEAVDEVRLKLGQNIAYKNFYETADNCTENVRIDIDSSGVDLSREGTYTANITATDDSGNSSSASISVIIYDSAYFEEDLWKVVDPILEKIIKPDMSARDKIKAIYRYVFSNCRYHLSPNDSDWIKAAVDGFSTGIGDCFTYASMTRALLTRVGFKNMFINRVKGDENDHYWNLVDIDDGHGWYHLDCINRGDGHPEWEIILFTEAQLIEVDKYIGDYHDYDRTKFPKVL